jgi:hypothetical protein
MGYVEFFRLDSDGAGWVDLSNARPNELLDLEIGLELEGSSVLPLVSNLFSTPENN